MMIRPSISLFLATILLSVCTAFPSSAQDKDTSVASPKPTNEIQKENSWPKTVKEAVAQILSKMSDTDKDTVKNTKKEDLIKFHSGWGMGIRNDLGLWQGNKALMKDTKANHPDEASMVIIEAVWAELQKQTMTESKSSKSQTEILKAVLKSLNLQNPEQDVSANSVKGDLRFTCICGYACYTPGVDKDDLALTKKYGKRCLDGTSDVVEGDEHGKLIESARTYAEKYNDTLLKQLKAIKE
jgi:hypothetical protein